MPQTTKSVVPQRSTAVEPTSTYAAAYAELAEIVERLRGNGSTSIDSLVDSVRRARAAHGVCRARLAAVRAEIDAEIAAAEQGDGVLDPGASAT